LTRYESCVTLNPKEHYESIHQLNPKTTYINFINYRKGEKNMALLDMKRLKKLYDGKKITVIEKEIEKCIDTAIKKEAVILGALYYFENSGRWMDNKKYNNKPFKTYLKERYNRTYKSYKELCIAFKCHEIESLIFGPGVVVRAREECGVKNICKVLKKMMTINTKQRDGIEGSQIDNVIEANLLPSKRSKGPTANIRHSKPTRADLLIEIERLNEIIAQRDATIDGLRKGLAV
jgi:hypothetical protein